MPSSRILRHQYSMILATQQIAKVKEYKYLLVKMNGKILYFHGKLERLLAKLSCPAIYSKILHIVRLNLFALLHRFPTKYGGLTLMANVSIFYGYQPIPRPKNHLTGCLFAIAGL